MDLKSRMRLSRNGIGVSILMVMAGAISVNAGDINIVGPSDSFVTRDTIKVYDTMNISEGASVQSPRLIMGTLDDQGTLNIIGESSRLIIDGISSIINGNISIMDGALFNTVARTYVGRYSSEIQNSIIVDGSNSRWHNGWSLELGVGLGQTELKITDGGYVSTRTNTIIGSANSSIYFDNGVLDTVGLIAPLDQLHGNGIINTRGLVSDFDLVFDNENPLTRQIVANQNPNQNIIINLDASGQSRGSSGAGNVGVGNLTVSDGVKLHAYRGYLGYLAGSSGTANISGQNSTWEVDVNMVIGRYGDGILNVFDGGAVVANSLVIGHYDGATGTVNLSGGQSSIEIDTLYAGWSGTGHLNINDGAELKVNDRFVSVAVRGSDSTISVSGENSKWINSSGMSIGGQLGEGNMKISDGGLVSNSHGSIIGEATITGENSEWINDGGLHVGYVAKGVINVEDQGRLFSQYAYVGNHSIDSEDEEPAADGYVNVKGENSVWENTGDVHVAQDGQGRLSLSDGGEIVIGNDLIVHDEGVLKFQLDDIKQSLITVDGDAIFNGYLEIDISESFTVQQNKEYLLMRVAGAFSGDFDFEDETLGEGDYLMSIDGVPLYITYQGGDGNDMAVYTVPEPASLSLIVMVVFPLIRRCKIVM